jgi:hypothetical protein
MRGVDDLLVPVGYLALCVGVIGGFASAFVRPGRLRLAASLCATFVVMLIATHLSLVPSAALDPSALAAGALIGTIPMLVAFGLCYPVALEVQASPARWLLPLLAAASIVLWTIGGQARLIVHFILIATVFVLLVHRIATVFNRPLFGSSAAADKPERKA